MLSRIAESLFWIGRYAERAEDTARLLDVHFHQLIVDPAVDEADTCAVCRDVMGLHDAAPEADDRARCCDLLAYDRTNPSSIAGSLSAARENARGVREVAVHARSGSRLNTTHLALPRRVSAARQFGPAPFFSYVRERAAMYSGLRRVHDQPRRRLRLPGPGPVAGAGRHDRRGCCSPRLGTPTRGGRAWMTTLRACSAPTRRTCARTSGRGAAAGAGVPAAGPAVPALGAARAVGRRGGAGPARTGGGVERAVRAGRRRPGG